MTRRLITLGVVILCMLAAPSVGFAATNQDSMLLSVTILSKQQQAAFPAEGMQVPMMMAVVGMTLIFLATPFQAYLVRRRHQ